MREHTTRRRYLKGAGAASTVGVAGLAGCTGGDDGGTETESGGGDGDTESGGGAEATAEGEVSGTLTVGVLQPLTGDLEYYGLQSLWGFLSGLAYKFDQEPLAVESAGVETIEAGDLTVELHIEDSGFAADQAQSVATDLVEDVGVDVLFGTASSGAARRVIETVAIPSSTPFVAGPAAAADFTADSDTCSEYVFRASENTVMDARSGGRYVARETEVESVYIMAADYSFGRSVAANYRDVLESEGVEIAGEQFVPQGYSEFEGLYENAVDAGADAVIGGFTVATLPTFLSVGLEGGYDLRLFGGFATQISVNAIGGVAQRVLGEDLTEQDLKDAKLGPFTTRYHWNQYDNEINDAFVDMYTDAYGVVPDLFTSGTFTAASSIVQAVEASGSTDGADIAAEMRGMTVAETPKGEGGYVYQEYNNQARSEMTVSYPVPNTEENWDAALMPGEPVARIGMDEVTLPADDENMDCSL
ncbi:substrate-binding domain-containing protein [Haloparvum alkalitolerans]|uniref:ABC transporter substrate-binding protein n=1 Tax=Haloparvum alkalitolerans TaxID=1042953 RepID=UPI003CEB91E7